MLRLLSVSGLYWLLRTRGEGALSSQHPRRIHTTDVSFNMQIDDNVGNVYRPSTHTDISVGIVYPKSTDGELMQCDAGAVFGRQDSRCSMT